MTNHSILLIAVLFVNSIVAQDNATYKEYSKEYSTYSFSDPDLIPAQAKIYPYFRFDGFTNQGKPQQWKVVVLENDYIKVQIMPEIGGKVWSAYDKIHQKDFLYNNGVVKFRDIAMRGPWVSGGIEANYGIIGHTPNSATPVDYVVKNNEDGSVSCFTSALDLLTRTRWVIETKLEKDKAYFTTTSYWFNATEEERPYYTWMNAGIPAGADLQFLYPGNKYIGHDGSSHNWPMDKEGRNLSKYSENNFDGSKSFHVMGTHSNYFGGFWEKDDFGMIRYSNRGDKLGKKIFLWAQSDAGKIWEDLLTDTSGQYVEIQSGRLFNQNVFSSSLTPFKQMGFKPYADESWTEYWFPFGEINGFTDANTMGAFKIQRKGQQLEVKMSPAQQLQDSLKVYNKAGKKIASTNISLTPLKPLKISLTLPEGEQPSILEVGKARIVLENNELQNLSRPQEISQDLDPESAYGLFLQGRDLYRFRNYDDAAKKIEASLLKNAAFVPALVEMAKLKLHRMEYDSAFYYSKKALSLDTYDGDANYYYGISALKTDRHYDALDGFEVASLSPSHRNAAYTSLGRIYLKEMDLLKAEEYVHMALQGNPNNLEALKILHVLARLNNNEALLKETAARIRQLNPIDHFIRFEKFYQDPTKVNEEDFVNLIRNEMPIESFLELAIWYAKLNRTSESIAVLKLAPNNAESLYWLAWLHKETGAYTKYLEEAEEASLDFVFPFREESVEVLNWAASVNKSWKPNYLMALIQDFRGNRTKAVSLLNKYEQVDFAPFYIFKARINEGASREATLALIKKAMELQPKQWRYKRIYAQILSQNDDTQKAIKVLENTYKSDKGNYVVGLDLINTLMLGNQYEKAEKILTDLYILPFEGASDSRKYYRQTKLMLAYKAMEQGKYSEAIKKIEEAEEWPEHLGVGKPYANLIDTRLENSLRVLIYTHMGSKEMATKYAELVTAGPIKKEAVLDEIKTITLKKDQRMF